MNGAGGERRETGWNRPKLERDPDRLTSLDSSVKSGPAPTKEDGMSEHVEAARELICKMKRVEPGQWSPWDEEDFMLALHALTQAHAQGRREGLEEAAVMATSDKYINDERDADDLARAIRAKAKAKEGS